MPLPISPAARLNTELAEFVAEFYANPLGFVEACYPWREPGTVLADHAGPDVWQRETLEEIGRQVRARRFTGVAPVDPIRIVVSSGHGVGKLAPLSLRLDTPRGEVSWGDLWPGDEVFGGDGRPTRILARHEQGVVPIYRVTFDDGSSTLCGADHLWTVRGRQDRRRGRRWSTRTTAAIVAAGVTRSNGRARARQWEIPIQGAAEWPTADLPVAPYLVGVWLGDGTAGRPQYTKPSLEVADRVRHLGYVVTTRGSGRQYVPGLRGLRAEPVFACGSSERRIPAAYKYASVDQRRELLRGLLDTDGECNPRGSVGYSTTSPRLAADVVWLVRSLGGKARQRPTVKRGWYPGADGARVPCRDCYRLTITLDWNPFTLAHRAARWHRPAARYLSRWIDRIDYSHDEAAMCITVDRPDGLYLANDFVVTHNSVMQAWLVDWIMSTRPNCRGTITANTATQLDTKTWAAIQTWTKLCLTASWFECNTQRLYFKGQRESWFCSPQSCKEENSEAFAGQHAATSTSWYVMDEGSAVPDKIYEVAEGGLTDGEPMIFVFGNPTRSTGAFYRSAFGAERHRWTVTVVDARESRFTNKRQLDEWIQTYGEDSDFVRVRVRGLPPAASDLQFISTALVSAAQSRTVQPLTDDPLVCGFDVARGGADMCVFWFRRGPDARSVKAVIIPGEQARDTMRLATVAVDVLNREYGGHKVAKLFVDATGGSVGGPLFDRLCQLGYTDRCVEVQFGAESPAEEYANMRAYMWGKCRDWLARGAIPADARLETDLTGPSYGHDRRDRLLLESKEHMKARGLDSPDCGDALALTFAYPVTAATVKRVSAPIVRSSWG